MNDKELADVVVALGVGQNRRFGGVPIRYRFVNSEENMYASEFVRDWRVAGTLQEKCLRIVIHKLSDGWTVTAINDRDEGITIFNESLPRAIIEACVKAKASS